MTATVSWTIYVANDFHEWFLYHNKGNGTFSEVGLLVGVGFNEDGKTYAGMGVDFADYDNDGFPDIVVTNLSERTLPAVPAWGQRHFQYVTNSPASVVASVLFSGWSTRFFDYDNDGWKDLFVAQGHVIDTIGRPRPTSSTCTPLLLPRNESGRFGADGGRRRVGDAQDRTRRGGRGLGQ